MMKPIEKDCLALLTQSKHVPPSGTCHNDEITPTVVKVLRLAPYKAYRCGCPAWYCEGLPHGAKSVAECGLTRIDGHTEVEEVEEGMEV